MLIKHARPRALGYTLSDGPGGAVEHETFTCGHCSGIVVVPHRADPATIGGMCKQCMRLTCAACTANGRCTPLEQRLETHLRRARFLKQVG